MKRSSQLASLNTLQGVREQTALLEMRMHQKTVTDLEVKFNAIKKCVDDHRLRILTLDNSRLIATALTASNLQEEANYRAVLERDLRQELFYLDTALSDLEQANSELDQKRLQWYEQHNRAEALAEIARG